MISSTIAVRPGSRFMQLGITLEVLDIFGDVLIYRCRYEKLVGPPRRCLVAVFEEQVRNGVLEPVEAGR